MTDPALLALDLGTGSVKALVVDSECRTMSAATEPYPVHRPHDGWAEQDPEQWWRAAVAATRLAIANAGSPEIAAIGISGQMHGTVLIDATGQPVRSAIIWEDRRSFDQVRMLTERIGAARLIELCGSPIATGFQAASLAWLLEHEPNAIERTKSILLPGDYLRFRLCGELVSDPSDAASTLLFDIVKRAWAPELLDALGLDRSHFPAISESAAITGRLSESAANEIGLKPGIPIAGGGGDAPLAALAAGAISSDTLLLTISTGSQAILPATTPGVDRLGRMHTWCSVAEPTSGLPAWYQMGATLASGRALRWLREDVMGASAPPLEESIASVPPGSDGLLFLPYLNGERTPHMDPKATGAFIGLRAHHGPAELSRAVMEGAAFSLLDAFKVLQELGGTPERIVLAGGGSRSQTWTQILADVFALPVDPLEEFEGSAMGAAIMAGVSVGWFDLGTGAAKSARFGRRVEPDPQATAIYRDLHPHFQHVYQVLKGDLHALGEIAARARAAAISA